MALGEYVMKRYVLTEFRAKPFYCLHDDRLEIWWEDVPYFVERVNESLSVVRANDDRRAIGVKVYGVADRLADSGLTILPPGVP